MVDVTIIQNFLIALALGALIGLEREYAVYRQKGHEYAGIRTFPLIALFGAFSAYLGEIISPWILIVGMAMIGTLIIVAYFSLSKIDRKHTGAVSEVAGFLTFFIGVLAYQGEIILAVVLAVTMTVILFARSVLHNFAKHINKQEMIDTLKFIVVAFVILPFLPNQSFGPYEIFNPYLIWLMVVFVSGISFVAYIALKWLGEKGIVLAGLLGGLASSTATTVSLSHRSKNENKVYKALALGVILANVAMFIRILFITFILNRELFSKTVIPLSILILVSLVFSYFFWKKVKKIKGRVKLGSPFTLVPALKFGLFFAIVLVLVKIADAYFSTKGVYLASFISGLADLDAITVSLSQLANGNLMIETAKKGILIAALTNMAVKGGIALWIGGRKFGQLVLGLFAVLIAIGIGLFFVF